MPLRSIVFLVVLVALLLLMVVYVGRRTAELARLGKRGRSLVTSALVLSVLLPFLLRGIGAQSEAALLAARVAFGVGLSAVIASVALLTIDGTTWVHDRLRALRNRGRKSNTVSADSSSPSVPQPPPAAEDGRREFLRSAGIGAALTLGGTTSLYGSVLGRHDYRVEDVPVPIRGLPRALDGYTIVQLSDVHIGSFVGDYELGAAVDMVRRARADSIVLTGDLVDHDPAFVSRLGEFAARLHALGVRDGVSAVPGNHDYYTGVDEVLDALRKAGVHVLRNDARSIGEGKLALLGVDDVWAPRNGFSNAPDLAAAIAAAPTDVPRILLCHNPETFDEHAPQVDLQLSGHTHGGQVNLVVRPADVFLPHGYVAGHYVRGESQIYVNRGFGTAGPPARVGSPPEVSRIVLVSA